MNIDWQTFLAAAVVVATLVVFAIRLARPKKKSGCGKNCGCGK